MQGIGDPDLFELSDIVEKSSKSGIFSNTRLLMIKDGFLYYFSNVPPDYKGHEPNLMASLKEFPKSSIQIKNIIKVRPQSSRSVTLIIEFHEKDMIDRDDIRKSISSKNFKPPVKEGANEIQQWKFSFSNFNKCKNWYIALETLKAHYEKHREKFDRFTEYMANFDNQLRKSLPRYSPNSTNSLLHNLNQPGQSSSSNPIVPQSKPSNFPSVFGQPQFQRQINGPSEPQPVQANVLNEKYQIDNPNIFSIQEEEHEEDLLTVSSKMQQGRREQDFKTELNKDQTIELKEETHTGVEIAGKVVNNEQLQITARSIHYQKEKEKEQAKETMAKIIEDVRESVRKEERTKAEEQAEQLQRSLNQQQEIIKKMEDQLRASKKAQHELEELIAEENTKREEEERLKMALERQKREEEQYRRLQQAIESEPRIQKSTFRQTNIKEESIQTQFQRDFIQGFEGNTQAKVSRYSIMSQLSHTPIINIRSSFSHVSQNSKGEQEPDIETYDYFWQLGQLYRQNQTSPKTQKELGLAQFVKKATRAATTIVSSYLDQNKPTKSLKLDRHIFEIEIVCERGRLLRTQGKERLIYSNQEHQRLKRTFKIYNQLNQMILLQLKKKPNFALRVPFCCLVEYKGYSALATIVPSRLTPSKNIGILKALGGEVPAYNLRVRDFKAKDLDCCLVTVATTYKSTKQDQASILKFPHKSLDFLELNRSNHISIESKKLFEEAQSPGSSSEERIALAKAISFCRELKKIMKANTPFLQRHKELDFFQQFLKNPSNYMEDPSTHTSPISGLLLYYCQRLLGIHMKTRIGDSELSYSISPVTRGLSLSALDISLFASKVEKLCLEGKFQLAELALKYSKELEEDYVEILLKEINLQICKQRYSESLSRIDLAYEMLTPNDPRKLKLLEIKAQCCQALGCQQQVLSCLKILLEETEYIYQNKSKLVEVYFLIAGNLSREQLNQQLIEVYRKIIKQAPEHKHRVILQFSQTLLMQKADPHILLDFIQQKTQQYSEAPQTQILLGDLYFKCRNYQKAITYYQNSFEAIVNFNISHPDLLSVFLRLFQCLPSLTQKKAIHRRLFSSQTNGSVSRQAIKKINTIVSEVICQTFDKKERDKLISMIEAFEREIEGRKNGLECRLLEWAEIENLMKNICKDGEKDSLQRLFEEVDYSQLFQKCTLMNTSEIL